MQEGSLTIERGTPADAAELIDYLRTIGGETENLSFGPDDFPFTVESEAEYLEKQVFAGAKVTTLSPDPVDAAGFERYMERFRAGLETERTAVRYL